MSPYGILADGTARPKRSISRRAGEPGRTDAGSDGVAALSGLRKLNANAGNPGCPIPPTSVRRSSSHRQT